MGKVKNAVSLIENTLNFLDNNLKSWSKSSCAAGGVARCSTYLFPLRSPGSYPPFRGFGLYTAPQYLMLPYSLAHSSKSSLVDHGSVAESTWHVNLSSGVR